MGWLNQDHSVPLVDARRSSRETLMKNWPPYAVAAVTTHGEKHLPVKFGLSPLVHGEPRRKLGLRALSGGEYALAEAIGFGMSEDRGAIGGQHSCGDYA